MKKIYNDAKKYGWRESIETDNLRIRHFVNKWEQQAIGEKWIDFEAEISKVVQDFEMWIAQDIHLLRLVAHKIAYKLYRSSYNRGARLFYPPTFLFLDYMLKFASTHNIEKKGEVILRKTREGIREELGMTVKTINRTITKLKEDGLIDTRKGKVVMSLEQYRMARDKIGYYVS